MSLLMIEGFDNYTAVTDITLGNRANYANVGSALVTGRSGSGQSLRVASSSQLIIQYPFPEAGTVIAGFAIRIGSIPSATKILATFRYNAVSQASIYLDSGGYYHIRKGVSATGEVITTTTASIGAWQYMELKLVVHDSTGSLELKLDGDSLGTVNGDTDLANGSDLVNELRIYALTTSGVSIDDMYICDGSGSLNNDFLGDCTVETIRPDGAGANTNWTPSAGANYAAVDEALEDGDTTYVSSSTSTDKDTYTFAAITSGNTDVRGVGVTVVAERKDGGERALTTETIDGGNTQTGANMYIGGGQYAHYHTVHETYDGTNKWTVAKVDGGEFGVTVSV